METHHPKDRWSRRGADPATPPIAQQATTRRPLVTSTLAAVALIAILMAGCAESSATFGTPAGMRDRINKLCEEARTDIENGDAEAIRALADRIETEVSTVYQPAVDTSERLRNHASPK